MSRAYLSLGSNIGDRAAHLRAGVRTVVAGDAYRLSRVYETAPVSEVVQDNFFNLVLELETDASPHALLARARAAEGEAGRVRTVARGPRTLDVDVLLVGDQTCDDDELTVPHPRMWERRFVLVPLAELAPDLVPDNTLAGARGDVRPIGTLQSLR